ncbi:MAG TPA: DUF2520 domain-containing protein [Bacteroidetes bacterium]|nr:DUF2520 domain-containing protein [Bacteroidota bacterium]HEX04445.1 DUF2520 domain-containing protein [Bacteroidota bacterium]
MPDNPSNQSHVVPQQRICVVGYGAVGAALTKALRQAGFRISAVCDIPTSPQFAAAVSDGFHVSSLETIDLDCELLIIATPDQSIEPLAKNIAEKWAASNLPNPESRIVMHLSGAHNLTPLQPLADLGWQTAAFHPIQTFPPGSGSERFVNIHVGITADPTALTMLTELALCLGVQPLIVPENERPRYHLASVIVSNFLPLLLELGASCLDGITDDRDAAVKALLPLMQGMMDSLDSHSPAEAITGPVIRNDLETVRVHLASDIDDATLALYKHLTLKLVDLAEQGNRLTSDQAKQWREEIG